MTLFFYTNCLFPSCQRKEQVKKKISSILIWYSNSLRVSSRSLICLQNVHRAPMVTLRKLSAAKARYCLLFWPAPAIKATRATTLAARKGAYSGFLLIGGFSFFFSFPLQTFYVDIQVCLSVWSLLVLNCFVSGIVLLCVKGSILMRNLLNKWLTMMRKTGFKIGFEHFY